MQPTSEVLIKVSPAHLSGSDRTAGAPGPVTVTGLLEWQLRGNVIIRKAQRAIQAGDCRPRRRSWTRFPLLAPTRDSFESGPPPSLVFRTEDVWRRCNQFIETSEFLIGVSPSHSCNAGRAGLGWMSGCL